MSLKQTMQRECRTACNSFMYTMIHEPYENGKKKKFFHHVKSLQIDRCGVPVLIKDGIKHTTSQAKANVPNCHFSSVLHMMKKLHYQTWILARTQICQILTLTLQGLLTFLKRLILTNQLDPIAFLQNC